MYLGNMSLLYLMYKNLGTADKGGLTLGLSFVPILN